jgi:hypothetical protein
MADPPKNPKDNLARIHLNKKCPQCYTYLSLNAKVCHSCGAKVGPVNRQGMAEKPPNIKGYVVAAIAILAFAVFVWWGFFIVAD